MAVNTSTGEATYSTTTLGAATHAITADYSGNFQFAASTTTAPISQVVDKAELTVRALNMLRTPNTANPDPLPYQITGFKNGENLATSGVTGTPDLTTTAVLSSPVGDYPITCALGSLAARQLQFHAGERHPDRCGGGQYLQRQFLCYIGALPEQKANVLSPGCARRPR